MKFPNNPFWIIGICYVLIGSFIIAFFDGTGDAGDSVTHYLIARYAPVHPELYFDHWGKPIFTLLASPFAQFGFVGMKVFNLLVGLGVLFFTYKAAILLKLKHVLIAPILVVCSTLFFTLTFSGLTEPLFALFLIFGIYLLIKNKLIYACLLLSFLPFVRSEGLLILGVIFVYLVYIKQYKPILLLGVGHVVLSIAGSFVFNDFLWLFHQNPYAKLYSTYGNGSPLHFIEKLQYVVGLPIYILFWIGITSFISKSITKNISTNWFILVLGTTCVFIFAHTLFWVLGIFNSMGLMRVLICIVPLIALISLQGFNTVIHQYQAWIGKGTKGFTYVIVGAVIGFQFIANHSSIHWDRDLSLLPDQICALEVSETLNDHSIENKTLFYTHPYLNIALDRDPYNIKLTKKLSLTNLDSIKPGNFIVWENWFTVLEEGINLDRFNDTSLFQPISVCKKEDVHRPIEYRVYLRK